MKEESDMCAAMTGREAYRVMFRDYPDVVTVEDVYKRQGFHRPQRRDKTRSNPGFAPD